MRANEKRIEKAETFQQKPSEHQEAAPWHGDFLRFPSSSMQDDGTTQWEDPAALYAARGGGIPPQYLRWIDYMRPSFELTFSKENGYICCHTRIWAYYPNLYQAKLPFNSICSETMNNMDSNQQAKVTMDSKAVCVYLHLCGGVLFTWPSLCLHHVFWQRAVGTWLGLVSEP